jgi:hypothetical protein
MMGHPLHAARLTRWPGTLLRAALAAGAVAAGPAQAAEPPLTVCMAADNAPLSYAVGGQPRGLDLRIAQAVAERLGRPLKVLLFESDFEKDSALAHEVNALLSANVCDTASGYPLLAEDLGPPSRPSARTPDYPGAKRKRERPFVPLGTLVASRAYQSVALGLVQRTPAPGTEPLGGLVSLQQADGMRLGVVGGTMAGSVAMSWRNGTLRKQLVTLSQHDDALALLTQTATPPTIDAVLLPLALWDGWRLQHPAAPAVASSWRRPIGINLGFVTLSAAAPVREAIDAVVGQALADGNLLRWAAAEGVTWSAPQSPEVSRGPGLAALAAD